MDIDPKDTTSTAYRRGPGIELPTGCVSWANLHGQHHGWRRSMRGRPVTEKNDEAAILNGADIFLNDEPEMDHAAFKVLSGAALCM